jgi:hypothetical protein
MPEWEYCRLTVEWPSWQVLYPRVTTVCAGDECWPDVDSALRDLGNRGWEIVGFTEWPGGLFRGGRGGVYLFKRPGAAEATGDKSHAS